MKSWLMVAAACAASLGVADAASALTYADDGDTSAYVQDWAIGPEFTNYAFLSSTGVFVGSWEVDQGPHWSTVPTPYSGQGAAQLLFGGSASDYTISTIDNIFADADHLAWVSTWGGVCPDDGYPCGSKVDESYVKGTSVPVPEPAAWALMIIGFGAVGASLRQRHRMTMRYA